MTNSGITYYFDHNQLNLDNQLNRQSETFQEQLCGCSITTNTSSYHYF